MSDPTWPGAPTTDVPVCPRHPDRVSYVRCQRCGRPTCPQCQRDAPVGIQCVDCVALAARTVRTTHTVFGGQTAGSRGTVTWTIIGLCVAVYLLQLVRPSVTEDFLFAPSVGWDEPWRALTAAFLHAQTPLHIGMNMLFLWQIGPYLESLLGRARFCGIYLVSALGGSAGVVLLAAAPSSTTTPIQYVHLASWNTGVVGASGAVFGLFGALIVLNRHLGRSSSALYAVLAINVAFGFLYPGIAWQAHVGGLVTGAALALGIARLSGPSRRPWHWLYFAAVLAVLVAAVVLKYLGVPEVYR
jgi:membrane associated rhomboid family serine protease